MQFVNELQIAGSMVMNRRLSDKVVKQTYNYLWKFNIAPENGWLEDEFPFGKAYFQGLY